MTPRIGGALADDGSGAPATGNRLPFGRYVHGRHDSTGAVRSVPSITGTRPWRQSAEILGDVDGAHVEAAYDLGGSIAALIAD